MFDAVYPAKKLDAALRWLPGSGGKGVTITFQGRDEFTSFRLRCADPNISATTEIRPDWARGSQQVDLTPADFATLRADLDAYMRLHDRDTVWLHVGDDNEITLSTPTD